MADFRMILDPAKLRKYRLLAKLSHAKAALKAGCSEDYYRKCESGAEEPSIFWVTRLAQAVGCAVEDLAGGWEEAGS